MRGRLIRESVLVFHQVGPGNGTQVISLGLPLSSIFFSKMFCNAIVRNDDHGFQLSTWEAEVGGSP